MAVVTPVLAITKRLSSIRLHDIGVNRIMARETIEEPAASVSDDTIYVAVAKDLKDSKSILIWAIQNSGGKRICLLHVHQPAQMIPLMGTKFPASSLKEQEVAAYREIERQNMHKNLDEHLLICQRMGVRAGKLHIEMDSVEKGIVQLISQYGIRKLVMGASSDKHYSRKMINLKSRKAIYVREEAPSSCSIQFICKGLLIYSRDGSLDGDNAEVAAPLLQLRPNSEDGRSHHVRSLSATLGQNNRVNFSNPAQDLICRVRYVNTDGRGGSVLPISSPCDTGGLSTSPSMLYAEGSSDESDRLSRKSLSVFSSCSSNSGIEVALSPISVTEGSEHVFQLNIPPQTKMNLHHSSPPSVLNGSVDETLYDQLEQAMTEAENARWEAFQETVRLGKAEKDAIEAIRKAKASENLYAEELKSRKRVEEAKENEKEELEKMKSQRDEVKKEFQLALDQKSSLETQIAASEQMVKELEQKIISAVDLLQNYKKERDELQMQRDNALREAEELRKKQGEASSTHVPQFFSDFSFSEIEEATNNFHPSLQIGEGGYGSIYRGTLCHTEVAIKILNSNSLQGPSEFQMEVDVLSKLRHPNLITLIGACPESWTLVYEYLPNGSLEDRLTCRDNASPLSWQARIGIAAELCSVLIFLHSCKPYSIVHCDLKPANVLLDENFVSKLSDFGICRVLSRHESSRNNTTLFCRTGPKGTFTYMDPEFLATGELTPKSDVYSFGIILLRLLTGRPALGITKEVQYALDSGKLTSLLDPLAGDWPFVQAEQLARLALRCCTSSLQLGSEEHFQPPTYFICPIFQELMRDPHVAADGYTYEAEALRGWLDSGHDTSPMTNNKLAHNHLVPNRALRSAIQDWLQNH
ncbi:putative U-box domain-containing protein kinase family protein [Quillaja saponaria]|uniref:RING-type E3 ubiquitin transferase n=1 Tax=Quillaja saponaria TaxID=32244 RepID=A0AAD7LS48_QUISA|nr:putative U-box domain-containing protein kinase family protein [Quillaja saponaria]